MKNYLKQGWRLFKDSIQYFHKGLKKNLFKEYLGAFVSGLAANLGKFHFQLCRMKSDHRQDFLSLQDRIKGLHGLLPNCEKFHYSILIELENPSQKLLHSCLTSLCRQTAPNLEILIGSKLPFSEKILQVIHELQSEYTTPIKLFDFSQEERSKSVYNLLADESKGNYLLFVANDDWIRPDLLYRYEQCLRTVRAPHKILINCHENLMTENGDYIPGSLRAKSKMHFPYIFHRHFDLRGMLIPKELWKEVDGLHFAFSGAEVEDLMLRMDLADANLMTIPFCLYSRRKLPMNLSQTDISLAAFIACLKEYGEKKDLNWNFEPGYLSNTVRGIPKNIKPHKIQVVIPFKEQKVLTLICIHSILKQRGVNFQITAVDNGSNDLSIAEAITQLRGEVLRIEEPFNYSRLNNLAVSRSKKGQECDLILFLNNDVELDEDALAEMVRWIDQPSIGMVGARLHYPNGKLQHGGIVLKKHEFAEHLWWEHIEKWHSFAEMKETKKLAIVDALTAACALMKKDVFLKIGGFDEIWYPIGFSDTSLAVKLNQIGLKCFYTPYAFGVHHESITRREDKEEIEASRWLYEFTQNTKV